MKAKQFIELVEKYTEALHQKDIDEGIVGYALFDTARRAFVTFAYTDYATYTGNVEDAYVAHSRFEALKTMTTMVDDYYDLKIVPLISNSLFGLSPKPGSLKMQL